MMPPAAMPPIRLMLAALWESFKSRTPAQRLAHARIRLAQADAVERAALREWDRLGQHVAGAGWPVHVGKVPRKLARRMRRMERRMRRLHKRTDRWSRIVGALDEAVNQ